MPAHRGHHWPARRQRWRTEQKQRIIEESYAPGASVSEVARRHGVAANLLFRWRKLLADGGTAAVGSDEDVVGVSEVRKLEARIRQLGRKTLEVEILKGALDTTRAKKTDIASVLAETRRWLMKTIATTLGIAQYGAAVWMGSVGRVR